MHRENWVHPISIKISWRLLEYVIFASVRMLMFIDARFFATNLTSCTAKRRTVLDFRFKPILRSISRARSCDAPA